MHSKYLTRSSVERFTDALPSSDRFDSLMPSIGARFTGMFGISSEPTLCDVSFLGSCNIEESHDRRKQHSFTMTT